MTDVLSDGDHAPAVLNIGEGDHDSRTRANTVYGEDSKKCKILRVPFWFKREKDQLVFHGV